ncbi:hypothetical protein THOM_3183 [Trachipleistophora hominis]|uniref:Uncharacterized protein n=1 Tax=Trachipleistophora hominis TaxID=72359 RepID=L7JRJ1_TRAHO|nr:hypothetical protein THOM_3183 [Trachipleistophora hominis]
MIIGLFFKILGVILFIGIIFVIFLWVKVKQFPLVIKSKDKNLPFAIGEEDKGGEGEGEGGDAEKGEGGDKGGEGKTELKGRHVKNTTDSLNMLNNHSAQTYGSMAYPMSSGKDSNANTLLSSEKGTRHDQSSKDITSNYLANQPRNAGDRFMSGNNLLGDPAEYNNMNNYLYNPMGAYDNLYNTSSPGNNYLMSFGQGINESGLANGYDKPDLSFKPNNVNLADKSDAKKGKKEEKSADSKKEKEELISPLNANLTAKEDESDAKKGKKKEKSADSKKEKEELISPLNANLTAKKNAMVNLAEANEVDMKKDTKEMLQEPGNANLTEEKDKKKKKKSSKDNENDLVGVTNVQDVNLKEKGQKALPDVQKSNLSAKEDDESEKNEKKNKKKDSKLKPKASKLKEKLSGNNLNEEKESKIASSNVAADKSSLASSSKKDTEDDKETKHHKDSHHNGESHHDEKLSDPGNLLDTSNLFGNEDNFGSMGDNGSALLGHKSFSNILA